MMEVMCIPQKKSMPNLKISKLIIKDRAAGGANDIAHDVVYTPISYMPIFRSVMADASSADELGGMLGYKHGGAEDPMTEFGCRIAFLYKRQRELMARAHGLVGSACERPWTQNGLENLRAKISSVFGFHDGDDARDKLGRQLKRIYDCIPNQGVCLESPADIPISCQQHMLCPWCRFRLVRRIATGLRPLFSDNKELCVVSFKVPWDSYMDFEAYRKQYRNLIEKLCIRNKFKGDGDFVVTLPESICGADGVWRLFWKTSVVTLVDKGSEVSLPVNVISGRVGADKFCRFLSDGNCIRWAATKDGVTSALRHVFAWQESLLEPYDDGAMDLDRETHVIATRLAGDFCRFMTHPQDWFNVT